MIIRKGRHSYFHLPKFHFGQPSLNCTVEFTESCLYDFPYPDRNQVNKLIGFSGGMHKTNSLRIGWNCRDGRIQLFPYIHMNGKVLPHERLGTFDINKLLSIRMYPTSQTMVRIHIASLALSVTKDVDFPQYNKCGYYLFPYFGGEVPAPHDIEIKLNYDRH